jgi:hypothetical protein
MSKHLSKWWDVYANLLIVLCLILMGLASR